MLPTPRIPAPPDDLPSPSRSSPEMDEKAKTQQLRPGGDGGTTTSKLRNPHELGFTRCASRWTRVLPPVRRKQEEDDWGGGAESDLAVWKRCRRARGSPTHRRSEIRSRRVRRRGEGRQRNSEEPGTALDEEEEEEDEDSTKNARRRSSSHWERRRRCKYSHSRWN